MEERVMECIYNVIRYFYSFHELKKCDTGLSYDVNETLAVRRECPTIGHN
jgi:hypothetical protein